MKHTKGFMKIFSILLLALLLMPFTLNADELKEAVQAFNTNDYSKAYRLMLPFAEDGNGEAQFYVGGMLVDGLGVKADPSEGVFWLEQAVGNQYPEAAQTLGNMYLSGHGIEMDVDKGAYYLTMYEEIVPKEDVEVECD